MYVTIEVFPLQKNKLGEGNLFINFNKNTDTHKSFSPEIFEPIISNSTEVNILEDELVTLKEKLQITIEELETSNEELQSTNEELQSTNEELQSTNEELETSNEELHSTNEELQTVNDELSFSNLELEFANKAFNDTLENLDVFVIILDSNLNIIKYTEGIVKFFDIKKANSSNFSTALLHSYLSLPNLLNDIRESLYKNKYIGYDIEHLGKNYSFSIKKIDIATKYKSNTDEGIILSFVDKTDIINKEKLLFQQSKMASMGEMIGNIAHQWRQPLNIINTSILKLDIDFSKGKVDEDYIDEFSNLNNEVIQQMSNTINDFRSFFKPNKIKQTVNIRTIVDEAIKFLEQDFENLNIKVINTIERKKSIKVYKNELIQVILNILSNSKDAIKANHILEPKIKIYLKEDNNYIYIQIEDNAGGIDSDVLDKIFEPYFTTKFKSDGTGIGLYMSKMIIEQSMDGKLMIINENEGIKVTISIRNIHE